MSSALHAHRYWQRADGPARAALLAALAQLQPGQRLRVADAVRARAPDIAAAEAGQQPDAELRAEQAPPPLVHYMGTALRARGLDPETRECELSFSSEEPYERWWGVEILGHKSGEIDMGWMASGRAPFLSDHNPGRQIGVVVRAWLEQGRGRAIVRFARHELAERELQDAADEVRVNVSVGYEIRELELVKRDGDTSTYRVTDWMPLECSLVAIPADMTVGVGRSVAADIAEPAPRAKTVPPPRMEHTMEATLEKPVQGDAAYKANVATIQRLAKAYEKWLKPTDVAEVIGAGADPQRMNDLIMQRMQSGAVDMTTLPGIGATPREARRYSFLRAIQAQIPGSGVDAGFERECSQALAKALGREAEGIFVPADVMFSGLSGRGVGEKRDFNVGTAGEAGNLVQTTVDAGLFADVLRPSLAFAQLGVTMLPGLTSNVAVPRKSVAGTLAALTEIQAATETQPTTTLATLSPKRIAAFVEPSKQAIIQSVVGIEAMLRQDLVDGAAVLLENQGINGNGNSPNARGIRSVSGIGSVVGGTDGAALSWAIIVGLETAVANANAGSTSRAGYLINTRTRGSAKRTQRGTNLAFCWDNGETPLNGYRAAVTNNVPSNLTKGASNGICSSAIFSADWSMYVMGLFGGLDITVDPYSLATTGQVRITLNQFFDFLCRQPGAFAVIDDMLTT